MQITVNLKYKHQFNVLIYTDYTVCAVDNNPSVATVTISL